MIRTQTRSSVLFSVALAGSAVLAACGGAGEAKAPAKTSEPESGAREREPTSIAEAEEQIARASESLSSAGDAAKKAEQDQDSSAPTSPGSSASTSTTPSPREETSKHAPADSCSQSCRALSSMRRAVSALCRMTGDEDARCSDAKKTLEQSESRVARCHCGA
jgi:hypothetical protein